MKINEKFKLPLPQPLEYVPPFVSEKPDPDGRIDDCTWASGLMLVATWTSGEVVTRKNGRPLGNLGLGRLRRQLRAASGDSDDSNLWDLARGVHALWGGPRKLGLRSLDRFIHGGASDPYTFEDLWKALNARSCAVVQGQRPAGAAKGGLYETIGPHSVFVWRADEDIAKVQDPMFPFNKRRPQLRKVTKVELEDFADGIADGPYCLVVARGSERAFLRGKRVA